jgi:hypothetical protein
MDMDPAILPYVDDPALAHIRQGWDDCDGALAIDYIVAEARSQLHRETNKRKYDANQARKAAAVARKKRKQNHKDNFRIRNLEVRVYTYVYIHIYIYIYIYVDIVQTSTYIISNCDDSQVERISIEIAIYHGNVCCGGENGKQKVWLVWAWAWVWAWVWV